MSSIYTYITKSIPTTPVNKVSFQNIQDVINGNHKNTIMICTLDSKYKEYIIKNTINIEDECQIINNLISTNNLNKVVFIYGKNAYDDSIYYKYTQLKSLGFTECYLYLGGLFEWLLMQDIHGFDEFPTQKMHTNIFLEFMPPKTSL